jgi:UDP-glucose 4-epimerase
VSRVVMVTGVSRYLGGRFVRALGDEAAREQGVERVIGVDVVPPAEDLGAAEFVRADIRNPIIAKVITQASVDTVVHMSVIGTPRGPGGRTSMKEINVIGTMQLLAACQKASSVRRLVVKSSGTVYGSSAKDPAMFTEDMEPRALPRSGYAKDSVEVEGYVRGFARRRPDVSVTLLRFANIVGPRMQTPLMAYLSLPVVPTPLGFDGRLQLVHEDDAIEVIRRATVADHPGTFNVAGQGVLTVSQAVRRAGGTSLPVPPALGGYLGALVRGGGPADFSREQMRFLRHGRVLDCSRLRDLMGFTPRYSTAEALDDFVRVRPVGRPAPLRALDLAEAGLRRVGWAGGYPSGYPSG